MNHYYQIIYYLYFLINLNTQLSYYLHLKNQNYISIFFIYYLVFYHFVISLIINNSNLKLIIFSNDLSLYSYYLNSRKLFIKLN